MKLMVFGAVYIWPAAAVSARPQMSLMTSSPYWPWNFTLWIENTVLTLSYPGRPL